MPIVPEQFQHKIATASNLKGRWSIILILCHLAAGQHNPEGRDERDHPGQSQSIRNVREPVEEQFLEVFANEADAYLKTIQLDEYKAVLAERRAAAESQSKAAA